MNTNENSSLTIDVGQKKDIARTTKDEIVQSGKVKLQIWIKYFNYIGGFWFLFLILLSNVFNPTQNQPLQINFYLFIVSLKYFVCHFQ